MKVLWKRSLSVIVMLAVVLGLVNLSGITARALDLPAEHQGKTQTTVTPAFGWSGGAAGFYITTSNDPLAYAGNWSIRYGNVIEGGVYVNDSLTDVAMIKIDAGTYYVALSDSGISGTNGMTVVIDGTYYDDNNVVTFAKTAYYYDGSRSTWKTDHTLGKNQVTVTPAYGWSGGASGFYITTGDDPLAYSGWSIRYGNVMSGGVYVDGSLSDVAMIKIDVGTYYVALSDSGISGTNGMTVVIDGVYYDDEDVVTFKKTGYSYDGSTWKRDYTAGKNKTTVTPAFQESNGASGFYITTENDPLAYAGNWSVRYGNVIEGGVYVNGSLSDVAMIKIGAGRYCVALSDSGISGTNGMTVVIDGTYYDDDNVVTFQKTTYIYDGTNWAMKSPVPVVVGDLNEDGVADVIDLVLMKKAEAGMLSVTDLNDIVKDGVVNQADLTLLRKIILNPHAAKNQVTATIGESSGSSENHVYFTTSYVSGENTIAGDPLAYDAANWAKRYGTDNANVTDGRVYVVYPDGTTKDVLMAKIDVSRYAVLLYDYGVTASEGMKVIIEGGFYDDENVVTFEKATFVYNGTSWQLVPAAMMAVKTQVNYTTPESGAKMCDARFISSLDDYANYESFGFLFATDPNVALEIKEDGTTPEGCVLKSTDRVYKYLLEDGVRKTAAEVYGDKSNYMTAYEITGVQEKTVIYARSYIEVTDGVYVYGDVMEIEV